jgi:hypothetical protein
MIQLLLNINYFNSSLKIECLNIFNGYPQNDKQHSSILITFPYLTFLNLKRAHADYAELFLLKTNMHLPSLLNLSIKYKSLFNSNNSSPASLIFRMCDISLNKRLFKIYSSNYFLFSCNVNSSHEILIEHFPSV